MVRKGYKSNLGPRISHFGKPLLTPTFIYLHNPGRIYELRLQLHKHKFLDRGMHVNHKITQINKEKQDTRYTRFNNVLISLFTIELMKNITNFIFQNTAASLKEMKLLTLKIDLGNNTSQS